MAVGVAEETRTEVSAPPNNGGVQQAEQTSSGEGQETSAETISAVESGVADGAKEGTESKVEGVSENQNKTQKQESSNTEQQTIARFQAEKDRAEAHVKNLYKQIIPFFDIDSQTGNIVGLKNQQGQQVGKQDAAKEMDGLMEAALISGDTNALKQILSQVKEEVKREAREEGVREIKTSSAIDREIGNLQKDFPGLYKKNGKGELLPNNDDPLFQETAKVIEEMQENFPNIAHPLNVRHAIEKAELRLLKKGLPGMQQQIKNEAQTRLNDISSSASARSGAAESKDFTAASVLSPEQIARLKREGEDEAGIARIAKIYQQAAKEAGKEGGLML